MHTVCGEKISKLVPQSRVLGNHHVPRQRVTLLEGLMHRHQGCDLWGLIPFRGIEGHGKGWFDFRLVLLSCGKSSAAAFTRFGELAAAVARWHWLACDHGRLRQLA